MSEQSKARRVQRATGLPYAASLAWIRANFQRIHELSKEEQISHTAAAELLASRELIPLKPDADV
ncbi:hypothetical protein KW797_00190 [Candidatus Parcubacteria bacterium]|nr:hypothetical protein [Candidatus Parcubacteria bacterium]